MKDCVLRNVAMDLSDDVTNQFAMREPSSGKGWFHVKTQLMLAQVFERHRRTGEKHKGPQSQRAA